MCKMGDALYKSQMKKLVKSFRDGEKFVLFVGAGQNGGHNVNLMWSNLIRKVSQISFRNLFREMGVDAADRHAIMQAMQIEESDVSDQMMERFCGNGNIRLVDMKLYEYISSYFPVEIRVSMIKDLMKDHYIPALQDYLYSECNYDILRKSFHSLYGGKNGVSKDFIHLPIDERHPQAELSEEKRMELNSCRDVYTLFVIARTILLNPQIESVITYNFDNFIRQAVKVLVSSPEEFFNEEEIRFLNERYGCGGNTGRKLSEVVKVKDVHDNGTDSPECFGKNTFPVYHVHGYIPDPHEEEIVRSPNIVMALEEFVGQQTGGLSWQDAVQIQAFRTANVMFMGCSMTDLTMKRMINFAHAHGYKNKIFILGATMPLKPKSGSESASPDQPHQNAGSILDGVGRDGQKMHLNNAEDTYRQIEILTDLRKRYFESLGASFINCRAGFTALADAIYEINSCKFRKS